MPRAGLYLPLARPIQLCVADIAAGRVFMHHDEHIRPGPIDTHRARLDGEVGERLSGTVGKIEDDFAALVAAVEEMQVAGPAARILFCCCVERAAMGRE